MRFGLAILGALLPAVAAAQTPAAPDPKWRGANDDQASLPKYMTEAEARRRGLLDENSADDPPPSQECVLALREIDEERAASERVLQRGEVEPADLKQVYEQEMYYADKRIKVINRLCFDGKSRSHDFGRWKALQALSNNRIGCAIVAKDCKPRKHW